MNLSDIPIELILILASAVTGLFKGIGFIKEGEQGIRLRFGKVILEKDGNEEVINIRGPGLVLLIPFIHSLEKRHTKQQTINLVDQKVTLKGGFFFVVSAEILFRISNVYKAMFEIDNLSDSLTNEAMRVLQEELVMKSLSDLASEEQISEKLLKHLTDRTEEWGVEIISFGLTDCAPAPDIAHLICIEEAVNMKLAAIKKAAEFLGTTPEEMPANLTAVLMGAPLVSAASSLPTPFRIEENKPQDKESLLAKIAPAIKFFSK